MVHQLIPIVKRLGYNSCHNGLHLMGQSSVEIFMFCIRVAVIDARNGGVRVGVCGLTRPTVNQIPPPNYHQPSLRLVGGMVSWVPRNQSQLKVNV